MSKTHSNKSSKQYVPTIDNEDKSTFESQVFNGFP